MQPPRSSVARGALVRTATVVTAVAVAVVLLGGSGAWLVERGEPGGRITSWGDGLWWALTAMTTVGYGDNVPVTLTGRLIAAAVMIAGVAVLGGVAAGIALVVARAVAAAEEQTLAAEAESLEQRLETRFDILDARLTRIEEHLERIAGQHERDSTYRSSCAPTSRTRTPDWDHPPHPARPRRPGR